MTTSLRRNHFFFVGLLFILHSSLVHAQLNDQKFHGFDLQGYADNGEKAWDVKGDTANISGSEISLSNVNATMYGEQKMNLTAESGILDQKTGKMHLEQDVIVTSESGSQLITDTLDWDRNNDMVTTEDNVLITDEAFTLTGKGMNARPGLKEAKIHEDVTVRIDTEPKKKKGRVLTITSDGPMIIEQAKGFAVFEDNVVAIQDQQILRADRMEIYFKGDMSGIKRMLCIGNVEIEKGENKSYAQRAEYDAEKQKLVLSGRPRLILLTEGENAITSFGN